MTEQKLAKITSVLLGPQMWLPALLITILLQSGLSTNQFYILFPILLFLQVIIPIAYLYLAVYFGKASAWDLPKREERYLFLFIVFICYITSLVAIYFLGNQFTFHLNLILLILLSLLSIITYFWKIGLHASLNTVGSIIINLLFDWKLAFLYLFIPIIFWARLILRRHTPSQLLAGVLVGGIFTILSLKYFNYI